MVSTNAAVIDYDTYLVLQPLWVRKIYIERLAQYLSKRPKNVSPQTWMFWLCAVFEDRVNNMLQQHPQMSCVGPMLQNIFGFK